MPLLLHFSSWHDVLENRPFFLLVRILMPCTPSLDFNLTQPQYLPDALMVVAHKHKCCIAKLPLLVRLPKLYPLCPWGNNSHQRMPPLSSIEDKRQGLYFPAKKATSLHFPFYRQKCNRIVTKCYPSVLHHSSAPNVATNTWQSTGKRKGHTRARPWHHLFGA